MLSFKPIIDLRKGEKKGGNKGNNIKKNRTTLFSGRDL